MADTPTQDEVAIRRDEQRNIIDWLLEYSQVIAKGDTGDAPRPPHITDEMQQFAALTVAAVAQNLAHQCGIEVAIEFRGEGA